MVQRKRYNKRSQKAKNTTRKNTMRKNTRRKNNYKKTNKRNLNRRSLKNKKNNKRNAHLQKGGSSMAGDWGRIGCDQDRMLYGVPSSCKPRQLHRRGEGYYVVGDGMIYDDFGTKCHKSCFMEKKYFTNPNRITTNATTVKCDSRFKNIYENLLTIYTAKKKSSSQTGLDEDPENNTDINYITVNPPDTIITKIIELLNGLEDSDSIPTPDLKQILGGYYILGGDYTNPDWKGDESILSDLNKIKKKWKSFEMKQTGPACINIPHCFSLPSKER